MTPNQIVDRVMRAFPPPYDGIPYSFRGQADLEAWLRAELDSRSEADAAVLAWLASDQWPEDVSRPVGIAIGIRFSTAVEWAKAAVRICPSLDLEPEAILIRGWPTLLLNSQQYLYAQAQAFDAGRLDSSQTFFSS
jgi:hypothetical protein